MSHSDSFTWISKYATVLQAVETQHTHTKLKFDSKYPLLSSKDKKNNYHALHPTI